MAFMAIMCECARCECPTLTMSGMCDDCPQDKHPGPSRPVTEQRETLAEAVAQLAAMFGTSFASEEEQALVDTLATALKVE